MITFIKDPRGSIGAEIIFDIFSTDRTAKFSQKEKKMHYEKETKNVIII